MGKRVGSSLGIASLVALVPAAALAIVSDAPTPRRVVSSEQRYQLHHSQHLEGDFSGIPPADAPEREQNGRVGSGGRAVAHRAGGRRIASPGVNARAPRSLLFYTGVNGAEPTLGVTDDGTVLYQGLSFSGPFGLPVPHVARSTDAGATWEHVSPAIESQQRHPVTLDPYIYTDKATDRTFTYDFQFGCSLISFTDDAGDSWTTTVLACGQNDHQTIFAGPPVLSPTSGYPNVVYYCAINGGAAVPPSTASGCSKSLDGGMSFVPTGSLPYVTNPQAGDGNLGIDGFCDGAHGHGFVGPDGTVYLPKGWCGQPWLAISKDEGATWTRVQVADNGMPLDQAGVYDHEAGVVADSKGNLYYTWVANDRLPYLAVSRDGGMTWSKPMMIGPPGIVETSIPGIDIGDDGKVAIVYMGSTNSPGPPYVEGADITDFIGSESLAEKYEDVTWNGYLTVTADALAKDPVFYTASVNDPKDPLIRGTCGPFRCQAEYDFLDVVIAKDGTAWASLVDGCIDLCVTEGRPTNAADGIVAHLVGGPRLR